MRYALLALLMICAAILYGITPVNAQETVDGLSDLVGARAGQAENMVTQRGYTWVKTNKEDGSSYSYWTESGSNRCVVIRTSDGRYQSIVYSPDSDCKETSSGSAADETASISAAAEGRCKLYNNKSNNYKYDGNCTLKQSMSSGSNTYDITLGNGDSYHFVEKGNGYKVKTPEGWSDNPVTMSEQGKQAVFSWYKWELTATQN